MELPFPCDPAVKDIGDSCSAKEHKRRDVLITQDEVANGWCGKNPEKGERVGKVVNVFVRSIRAGGVFGRLGWRSKGS